MTMPYSRQNNGKNDLFGSFSDHYSLKTFSHPEYHIDTYSGSHDSGYGHSGYGDLNKELKICYSNKQNKIYPAN